MGNGLIDTLGQALKVDIAASWQPDDLFFELAKDREAIWAMLAVTETGSKKKAILRKALAGDGRTKVEGWLPCYLRFPQAGYTDRPLAAGRA